MPRDDALELSKHSSRRIIKCCLEQEKDRPAIDWLNSELWKISQEFDLNDQPRSDSQERYFRIRLGDARERSERYQ